MFVDIESAIRLHVDEGMSAGQVARSLGVDRRDVLALLRSHESDVRLRREQLGLSRDVIAPFRASDARIAYLQTQIEQNIELLQSDMDALRRLIRDACAEDVDMAVTLLRKLLSQADRLKLQELNLKLLDQIARETGHYKADAPDVVDMDTVIGTLKAAAARAVNP